MVFSQESMKEFKEAPDRWWASLTWMEKSAVKSAVEMMGRIATEKMEVQWDENPPEIDEQAEEGRR